MEDLKSRILNVSENGPDVAAFDSMMSFLSQGNSIEIMDAQEVLTEFKGSSTAFYSAIVLLTCSTVMSTRFFALQVIDEQINCFWNALDENTQTNVRNTIITEISKECTSFQQVRQSKVLLTKLNSTLVSIAKRLWPVRWPDFIKDVCKSATPTDPLVENNLNLLRIVGEEVFEFGSKTLTSRWVERKKKALASDFQVIMELCCEVLRNTADTKLLKAVLETLNEYIPWLNPELIFDKPLLDFISQLAVGDEFIRTPALRCLAEVVSISIPRDGVGEVYGQMALRVFEGALSRIISIFPASHYSLSEQVVQFYENNPSQNYEYVTCLHLFLTSFMRNYYSRVYYDTQLIRSIHSILVGMSNIMEKELFKACVEYWWWLGVFLLRSAPSSAKKSLSAILSRTLSDVRYVLIKQMAKPEEVIIVVEDGEVRRESLQDVEELQLYELMRETLVFLANLDSYDTREIMTKLMNRQRDRSEWSWQNCNSLCWAVGGVLSAMTHEDGDELYLNIMQGLLMLCKEMEGKENRAVILSCIMFIVGQYPRYLRRHKSYFHTVLKKVFEFMQETSAAGVQDMALDTLLKLARQLPKEFADSSDGKVSLVHEMADTWSMATSLLNSSQIRSYFRAVGYMLAPETGERDQLIMRFLGDTMHGFKKLTEQAVQMSYSFCLTQEATTLLHYLGVFSSIAETCGDAFMQPMDVIVQDLYGFYRLFTGAITSWYAGEMEGVKASSQALQTTKAMRREILRIFTRFVEHTQYLDFVAQCCMPDIFAVVLQDYRDSEPQAREAEALALVVQCVQTLGNRIEDKCAVILDHTFSQTVAMLADSTVSLPDLRVNLFRLLQSLNEHCFNAFVQYTATYEDVLMAMLWAFKHTDYPTMKTGLDTLNTFLKKVVSSPFAESFFTTYMQRILADVLVAAMDTLHAAGFPQHASILFQLFHLSSMVPANATNIGRIDLEKFLQANLSMVSTLDQQGIMSFITKCYDAVASEEKFRDHLADFLIEAKVWGAEQENKMEEEEERRAREETIPGFLKLSLHDEPNPFKFDV